MRAVVLITIALRRTIGRHSDVRRCAASIYVLTSNKAALTSARSDSNRPSHSGRTRPRAAPGFGHPRPVWLGRLIGTAKSAFGMGVDLLHFEELHLHVLLLLLALLALLLSRRGVGVGVGVSGVREHVSM